MKINPSILGFSLLEVLVALAIFAFTAVALLDELNASLRIVGRQREELEDALILARGFSLLELEARTIKDNQKDNTPTEYAKPYPTRFPTLPWVDEDLEKLTPRSQTETIILPIEGFPQMLKTRVWLETRDRKGHLQTLGSRILLAEDPKVMENYKKLLQSGKEPKDSETETPQKPDSSQLPSETSLEPPPKTP